MLKQDGNGNRWCPKEKHWTPTDNFHKNTAWCKDCREIYRKEHYDPEKMRQRNLRRNYKDGDAVYARLFALQEGKCLICESHPKKRKIGRSGTEAAWLYIDSHTITGRVCALLCYDCKFIVEKVSANPGLMNNVRRYLEEELSMVWLQP
jgi:hypothetical protein